jgi:hypothetical protein
MQERAKGKNEPFIGPPGFALFLLLLALPRRRAPERHRRTKKTRWTSTPTTRKAVRQHMLWGPCAPLWAALAIFLSTKQWFVVGHYCQPITVGSKRSWLGKIPTPKFANVRWELRPVS